MRLVMFAAVVVLSVITSQAGRLDHATVREWLAWLAVASLLQWFAIWSWNYWTAVRDDERQAWHPED